MTKASSIFDVYEWANYITQDENCEVWIWGNKPDKSPGTWIGSWSYPSMMIPNEIDEFKDKDWKECCIERPKEIESWEDLQEWAKGKAGTPAQVKRVLEAMLND